MQSTSDKPILLSVIVPCFNEERSLRRCVERVLEIEDEQLSLEMIIVDDNSTDGSLMIARELEKQHPQISVLRHEMNQGKGAAIRTGVGSVTGDYVAIQDADLEYDPMELKMLLVPLINDDADMVIGSRFLSTGFHRVLHFWHYLGNRFLTFFSNMLTDLNLTDMESCYKVFRRDVIQSIDIREDRFGFEPEVIAKAAHMRLRIFEIGISYRGRTYGEGKQIGLKDGFRALYCIFRYSAHKAPWPMQFVLYLPIGGFSAVVNLLAFLGLLSLDLGVFWAALSAFAIAAVVNYLLCIAILFRHKARWGSVTEVLVYSFLVSGVAFFDAGTTQLLSGIGSPAWISKIVATGLALILNFAGRRLVVFQEPPSPPWEAELQLTRKND
jgi:dolichol-phosphate mannosyltransferase